MAADTTHRFRCFAEDRGCFDSARIVADRVAVETWEWIDLDTWRQWEASSDRGWDDFYDLPYPKRLHGRFTERDNDEILFRKVLGLLADLDDPPDLAVIARDDDGARDLPRGFGAAMKRSGCDVPVVLAAMSPESESWQIVLFEPTDEPSRERLAEVRSALGTDPRAHPEAMRSTTTGPRDPKRIRDALFADADGMAVLHGRPLGALQAAPAACGLPAYLRDVTAALQRLAGH